MAATWDDGAFYLTNASGSWTRERLTSAPTGGFVDGLSKYDGDPSIVIRDDGSLAIAFTRYDGLQCAFGCVPVDPQGIFLVTNRSGSWSEAVPIIEGRVQEPSLQATEGRLHLAYSRGGDEDRTVEYAHSADDVDSWTIETVGEGETPTLRMGRDGFARISFRVRYLGDDPANFYGFRNLYYAAQADSGEFVVERVPGDWRVYTQPLLTLGVTDEPQIVFFNRGDPTKSSNVLGDCGALSIRRTAGTWSDASVVFPEGESCALMAAGVATDSDGTLHVISKHNLTSMGVWYANDAGGEFRAQQFRDLGDHSISDIPDGDSAIAIDDSGRPHVLFVVSEFSPPRGDRGWWYGIGPAQ